MGLGIQQGKKLADAANLGRRPELATTSGALY